MKKVFEDVKYHNALKLFLLFMSTILLLFLSTIIINKFVISGIISFLISIILSAVYFYKIYKQLVKNDVFLVFVDRFEFNEKIIYFDTIKSYKIHWLKGAGLKIICKNGKTLRISANSNLYNSDTFVKFCEELDKRLSKLDTIERQKTFFETKYGYYFSLSATTIVVGILIYETFTGFQIKISTLVLMLICLSTIWSGMKYKRKS
jgi:uncharacterized membrane protein